MVSPVAAAVTTFRGAPDPDGTGREALVPREQRVELDDGDVVAGEGEGGGSGGGGRGGAVAVASGDDADRVGGEGGGGD
ncbi:hypothetical protein SLS56_007272 [Neofusicoccum ribis]|uniref:Uncharacterized protein n=1 Tax=Neofusicoccum ribis TaxID=45134 RepID=A0ABR3SNT9_9PEZI